MADSGDSGAETGRHVVFWLITAAMFVGFLWLIADILLPFVAGAAIAYFLNPLADRLSQTGIGRTPAAALIITAAAVLLAVAIILLGPLVFDQLRQFAETLPEDFRRLLAAIETSARGWLGPRYDGIATSFERGLSGLAHSWSGSMAWALQQVWDRGLALVNLLSLLLITPVVAFYLLADWPSIVRLIDDAVPRRHAPTVRRLAAEINGAIAAFVRGQGTLCLILAAFYAIGLTLIGIKYGLVIGLAVGFISFVPFVGWSLGLILAAAVAVAQGWPSLDLLVKVVALFAAAAALDTAVLAPRIVGPRVGLHPVWLIFAVLAFGSLLGVVGVLIAVPAAAAAAVLVRFAVRSYLESDIYRGDTPPAPLQDSLSSEPRADGTV